MSNSWLICPRPNPRARLRLFCFPCAGGRASLFRLWPDSLPTSIEVCSLELPGHGARIPEAPFTRLTPLVHRLAVVLRPYLNKPFAFFGHSMGALLSFELARQLRRLHQAGPLHLFLAGAGAPHWSKPEPPVHTLPEQKFLEALRIFNGIPPGVLAHKELMQLMLPVLRADFAVCETYSYASEPPLTCPFSVFGGLQDKEVSLDKLEAWRMQTSSSFSLRLLPGDHFFLQAKESPFLPLLARELGELMREIPGRDGPRAVSENPVPQQHDRPDTTSTDR